MPSSPLKILVIEDERDVCLYMTNLLRARGFTPVTASGAEDGLAMARSDHPDLIVLDAMLPGDEAHHIYYQLKTDTVLKTIPVVLMSSIQRRAMGRFPLWPVMPTGKRLPEPEAFIAKPPEADDFMATIARLIHPSPVSDQKEVL
jgi:CheY-like chemotaxis protein